VGIGLVFSAGCAPKIGNTVVTSVPVYMVNVFRWLLPCMEDQSHPVCEKALALPGDLSVTLVAFHICALPSNPATNIYAPEKMSGFRAIPKQIVPEIEINMLHADLLARMASRRSSRASSSSCKLTLWWSSSPRRSISRYW
jgi:hypothetical protein